MGGEDRQVPRQAQRHVQGGGHDGVPKGICSPAFCKFLYCIYVFVALQKRESYNTQNYCLGGTGP